MAKKRRVTRQETRETNLPLISGIVGIVALAVIGLLLYSVLAAPAETEVEIPEIEGVVAAPSPPTRGHDETLNIEFGELPPVGGTHNPIWQNCGIYSNPVRPEHAVHSLEHGAVWITYQPDLDPAQIEQIEDQIRNETYIIMSPYPNLRSPIVLTAWSLQLEVESADDARIREFIEAYEQGPQTPELGGACTGGVSFTVES